MRRAIFFATLLLLVFTGSSFKAPLTPKTIHVLVALCDNVNQGIVPVPSQLGKGDDPGNNLYWGALYGVKTFLDKKSSEWQLVKTVTKPGTPVMEQALFKHNTKNVYLLAEAYKGIEIKKCITDFFEACSGNLGCSLEHEGKVLQFGGNSSLISYVGHDGLMEFDVKGKFQPINTNKRDAIILACVSKGYFKPYLEITKANPLVWSTGLMSPEAYTLKAAIDGWIKNETDGQIRERAAQAYHKYQKCGIRGARNLLVTGF